MNPGDDFLLFITLSAMAVSVVLMIVIPILPGQFLIWLAALIFGLLTDWSSLSLGAFFALTALMTIAALIDWIAGWIGARKGGASWPAIIAGLVLGVAGLIFFNALGAVVGVLIGIVGYEYWQDKDWGRSWKAGLGYLGGLLASLVVRLGIAVVMIVIFWQQVR